LCIYIYLVDGWGVEERGREEGSSKEPFLRIKWAG